MDPNTALAQALRLHRTGSTKAAAATCRQAVQDENPVTMRLLGLLLAETGWFDGARHWAIPAVARDRSAKTLAATVRPADPALLHALGTALHEAGRPAEAITAYRTALAAAPGHVASWHNLGSALQATGDLDAAMAAHARAYATDPASFPRIAQKLAAGPFGQVWLSAAALRAKLQATARGHSPGPGTLPAAPGQHRPSR